jgi:hypothetical protein
LFSKDRNLVALSHVMDQVNQRFGIQGAYFGGLHNVLQRAPMRIAFNRIPNVALEGLSEKDNRPPPSSSPMSKMGRSWGSPPGA